MGEGFFVDGCAADRAAGLPPDPADPVHGISLAREPKVVEIAVLAGLRKELHIKQNRSPCYFSTYQTNPL